MPPSDGCTLANSNRDVFSPSMKITAKLLEYFSDPRTHVTNMTIATVIMKYMNMNMCTAVSAPTREGRGEVQMGSWISRLR